VFLRIEESSARFCVGVLRGRLRRPPICSAAWKRVVSFRLAIIGHVDWDGEAGVEKSLLFPTEDLRRERRADKKHQGQRRYLAQMRGPRVTLPDSSEQGDRVG
jgi:hypothetical protein